MSFQNPLRAPSPFQSGLPKKSISNRDVYLEGKLITSPAYRELNGTQQHVYLRFMQKRTWTKNGSSKKPIYHGRGLVFPYSEAREELKISDSTFNAAIKKLVEVGLIDIEYRGNPYKREPSIYAISDRWMKYGTSHFRKVERKKARTPAGFDAQKRALEKPLAVNLHSESLRFSTVKGISRESGPTANIRSEKMKRICDLIANPTIS